MERAVFPTLGDFRLLYDAPIATYSALTLLFAFVDAAGICEFPFWMNKLSV